MAAAQTQTAVLGALSIEPQTGYELRNNIKEVLGHFWSESYGQIYPTLAWLVGEGLVRAGESGRAGSSTYSITAAGTRRLKALLRQPVQDRPPRNGLLLRLFFGRQLGVTHCLHLLDDAAASAQERLAHFGAIRAEIVAEGLPDAPYFLLTVDLGERVAAATIEWVEASRRSLEDLPSKP